jgi:L-lysine exporter family protein LysE/ArgO
MFAIPFNFATPAFTAGMVLSLSLIMAIGPQNVHVLRMGLQRQHVGLTVVVSAAADAVLIALGVLGLAGLGGMSEKLHGALVGGGAVFLLAYGWQALRRCWQPAPLPPLPPLPPLQLADADASVITGGTAPQPKPMTRWQAVMSALAFSWLNPHAWLDTAVLIGTASLAYGRPDNTVFGLGAAAGSVIWFAAWGLAVFWLGRRLASARVTRVLDGLVAVMMLGTAAWLLSTLV